MLTYKDIIKEDDPRLRERSIDVNLPLADEDLELLEAMNEYLENGYDEEKAEICNIRPGVGLSAVQIGVLKKLITILTINEKGQVFHYAFINPKIISESAETAYLPGGEGCLSIDREVAGLVHRSKRIKVRCHLYNFEDKSLNKTVISLENYLSIVFQHEYDHLNGILFIDRIDKFNPFYVPKTSSPIVFETEENIE
ncbi:MAG: peptide deformylase [Bacilli bacterium]|nr:peptide deformylase [Bacilli bacterium]